jgi:hypothetical protein
LKRRKKPAKARTIPALAPAPAPAASPSPSVTAPSPVLRGSSANANRLPNLTEPATQSRKRRHENSESESDELSSPAPAAKKQKKDKFAALTSRLHYIPQEVIRSKWTFLPEPAQNRLRELFRSLERPVIAKHRDERQRIEAQSALGAITRT